MKLKEDHSIHPVIFRALEQSLQPPGVDFEKKRVRVSSLINPAWMNRLLALHDDEIEVDPQALLAAELGTAWHAHMENNTPHGIVEEEVSREAFGWTITGHIDLITETAKGWVITDYKTCSVFKVQSKDFSAWEAQLNAYRWLAWHLDGEITLEVVVLLTDWKLSQARRNPDYPPVRCFRQPIARWGAEQTAHYVKERLERLRFAAQTPCTDEERWAVPGHVKVKVPGRKTALKRAATQEEAEAYAREKGISNAYYETHPPQYRRCDDYCYVAEFCSARRR